MLFWIFGKKKKRAKSEAEDQAQSDIKDEAVAESSDEPEQTK